MTKKVYIRSFGCQMNEYDADKMADVMRAASCEAICSGSDSVSGAAASVADGMTVGVGAARLMVLSYRPSCQIVNNLIDNKRGRTLG